MLDAEETSSQPAVNDTSPAHFVVQHHTGYGQEHWDLMLEDGPMLATWRLDQPPGTTPDTPTRAVRIGDHRKAYLTYRGPISRGRGRVAIYDSGGYTLLARGDRTWVFELRGTRLSGVFSLRRQTAASSPPEVWELRREEATPSSGPGASDRSVV